NTYKTYGHVVDAYIPNRRSKAGKRFGFVRFITDFDVERLVNNLCTVWVGRYKLHANVARFQKESLNKHSNQFNDNGTKRDNVGGRKNEDGAKGMANSYAYAVKGTQGKVKEFISLTNLKVVLAKEVGTWFSQIIQAHIDFTIDEKVTWVEIKGDPCKWWSRNTFSHLEGDSDVEEVPESKFKEESNKHTLEENSVRQSNAQSEDSFGIYEKCQTFCWKRLEKMMIRKMEVPWRTHLRNEALNDAQESICSGHFKKSEVPRTCGSILQLIDDLVNVGQTMRYDMTGCLAQKAKRDWVKELCVSRKVNFLSLQETKMEKIELFCIKRCWGNFAFDYVYSKAVGEVVTIGDFNEVRDNSEKFGSVFNKQDHRPILMQEIHYYYGPTPFKFFHYWFEIDGFDKLVEDSWKEAHVTDQNA
nr:hypothetical protein [Tanacetum cinerariifolium]